MLGAFTNYSWLLFAIALIGCSSINAPGVADIPNAATSPSNYTTVETKSGPVTGVTAQEVAVFKGIPYAAGPVGDLRWRAPQSPKRWDAPLEVTSFGHSCNQRKRLPPAPDPGPMDEDCLFLNIWAPEDLSTQKPVLVWIHGGAFVLGSSRFPYYDGEAFAESGIVFVSFNYRLGRFGFFAHPALAEETSVANYAFLDQVKALEWVRDNIALFGGDPRNVTIAGESAGGVAVTHLMSAPRAEGLFHKAIVESGSGHQISALAWRQRGRMPSLAQTGQRWALSSGLGEDASVDALRSISAEDILSTSRVAGAPLAIRPVIDGVTVLDDPAAQFENGNQAKVPLLIGSTSYEASLAENLGIRADQILALLGREAEIARQAYAAQGMSLTDDEFAMQAYGDATFVAPARYLARQMAKSGAPVWLYHFDVTPEKLRDNMMGAPHGGEIPYVFKLLDELPYTAGNTGPSDDKIASSMHDAWVSFIKYGDPRRSSSTSIWEPVTKEQTPTLIFRADGVIVDEEFESESLNFYDERFLKIRSLTPLPAEDGKQ